MRTAFHQQLDALTRSIGHLCGLAGSAMQQATRALLEADIVMAEIVISDHDKRAARAAETEAAAFTLLALQAPVASDLRAVVSSIKNVGDVDRMHALALHVAKTARRRHPAHAVPDDITDYFAHMGRIAVDIGINTKDIVLTGDTDNAAKLAGDDDAMDDLHRQLFSVVMENEWPYSVATAVDVTLLSRYYERFADHAVEIGRRVIFQTTGVTSG
jgi:phosphate transport system protein